MMVLGGIKRDHVCMLETHWLGDLEKKWSQITLLLRGSTDIIKSTQFSLPALDLLKLMKTTAWVTDYVMLSRNYNSAIFLFSLQTLF